MSIELYVVTLATHRPAYDYDGKHYPRTDGRWTRHAWAFSAEDAVEIVRGWAALQRTHVDGLVECKLSGTPEAPVESWPSARQYDEALLFYRKRHSATKKKSGRPARRKRAKTKAQPELFAKAVVTIAVVVVAFPLGVVLVEIFDWWTQS